MADVTLTPSDNGPYTVSGPVTLTDVDGDETPHPDQTVLCRCGYSNNKPFCDATHLTIDFDGTLKNSAAARSLTDAMGWKMRCRASRHDAQARRHRRSSPIPNRGDRHDANDDRR
jgi:CDGSH-type Zn-finger protein